MQNNKILLIFFLLPILTATNASMGGNIDVLLLYSDIDEKDSLLRSINTEGFQITSKDLNSIFEENFTGIDILIIISSIEIDLDDSTLSSLELFLSIPEKISIIITPFLSDLGLPILELLGISEGKDIYGLYEIIEWEIIIFDNIEKYDANNNFTYTGAVQELVVEDQTYILANSTKNNSTMSIDFEFPILINKANKITSPVSLVPNYNAYSSQMTINQFPLPNFTDLLFTVINQVFEQFNVLSISDSNNTVSTSNTNGLNTTVNNAPDQILVISLIAFSLIILYFRKIIDKTKWLLYKFIGFGVLIFGGYFNVQDRNLNSNQLMINQTRSQIFELLNKVEDRGCHIREIKNSIKIGSSSLLWHLQILEEFDYVQKYNINNNTVYVSTYYADTFNPKLKEIDLKLRNINSKIVLEFIKNYGRNHIASFKYLFDHTGINRKNVLRILKKLHEYDIVELYATNPIGINLINSKSIEKLYKFATIRSELS